jgi:YD repeat-containing protein
MDQLTLPNRMELTVKQKRSNPSLTKAGAFVALCTLCAGTTIAMADALPPPPQDPGIDSNGVDVKSLAIMYAHQDVSIGPADYHGLQFSTYYSNWTWRNSFSSDLNDATSCNGCGNVSTDSVSVGNHNDSFRNGVPNTGDGSSVSGSFVYTLKDGTTATFATLIDDYSPDGSTQITDWLCNSLVYPDGTTLTFNYETASNGANRLQSVTTNTGWQIKISYLSNDPSTGVQWGSVITRVTAINNAIEYCNPVADSCSLTHSWPYATYSNTSGPNNGSYTYITDAAGAQTRIYHGNIPNGTFSIKTSDSATDNRIYSYTYGWDYGQNGNAYHVTQASRDGVITNYSYGNNSTSTIVTASVPNYETRSYTSAVGAYAAASGPVLTNYTNPLGRADSFTYDNFGRELTVTRPEGNSTQLQYDNAAPNSTRGNLTQKTAVPKPGSGLPNLTESWQFPACSWNTQKTCNQPSSYTDPKGNLTTYTYDPASGHIATETLSADSSGFQPVKRYFYTALYAWILNSQSQYVQEPTSIYMLTQERTCMRTATVNNACSGGSTDEVVTNYYYGPQNTGPNNLLVRGVSVAAGGQTRMTCYGYDIYGNKISETSPRAGLSSCP